MTTSDPWEKTSRDGAHEDIAAKGAPCATLDEARVRCGARLRGVDGADAEAAARGYLAAWRAHTRDTSAPQFDLDAMEARLAVPTCSRCGAVVPQTEPAEYWDGRAYDRHVGCPQEHGLFASDVNTHPLTREEQRDLVARVRALEVEARRLRSERDEERKAHRSDLRDDAKALDDLVAQVWRATGETHEPPADVAALTDRIDALRCESESLARRLAGRDETNANLLGRLIAAESAVAAARREGAEAMREACAAECGAEASSLVAAIERGSVTAETRLREARLLASTIRRLPLPEVTP